MPLNPPILSASDPRESAEGSIDPFALQAGYERLAERVLPSITIRMNRIRFLTAMCVSAHVCSDRKFEDKLAADGMSPPWLVFEWYLVEAHVRAGDSLEQKDRRGLAGWTKVRRAVDTKRAVCAASYLKVPTVFGVHGIYRRLATALRLVTDDMTLDEGGWALLGIWEREQNMEGFVSGRSGTGAELREELRRAVELGMERGATDRPNHWKPWATLPGVLKPSGPGAREAQYLYQRLLDTDSSSAGRDPIALEMRSELIGEIRAAGLVRDRLEERGLFRKLIKKRTSESLRVRLDTIDAYEALCRPVMDSLSLIRHLSTVCGGPVGARDFSDHAAGKALPRLLRQACERVSSTADLVEAEPSVTAMVERYRGIRSPGDLFEACLEHHTDAQRAKPPDGKRPWVERVRGDRVVARPQYRLEEAPSGEDLYVHEYRTPTVSGFLRDLRRGAR